MIPSDTESLVQVCSFQPCGAQRKQRTNAIAGTAMDDYRQVDGIGENSVQHVDSAGREGVSVHNGNVKIIQTATYGLRLLVEACLFKSRTEIDNRKKTFLLQLCKVIRRRLTTDRDVVPNTLKTWNGCRH